tara:strand:+ start:3227 stop:3343 length:117 start_codon:yes stop_codon:yes gene_type:complete
MCNFHKTKSKIREENRIQYSGADPESISNESYQLGKVN